MDYRLPPNLLGYPVLLRRRANPLRVERGAPSYAKSATNKRSASKNVHGSGCKRQCGSIWHVDIRNTSNTKAAAEKAARQDPDLILLGIVPPSAAEFFAPSRLDK